jgi:hypothetical protein
MTATAKKADDDIDAFEALESEQKEFIKVRLAFEFFAVELLVTCCSFFRMQRSTVFCGLSV